MIAYFHDGQRAHDPQFFLSSGAARPCPEKPSRVDALLGGLQRLGVTPVLPPEGGEEAIAAVHPGRYLTFLQGIHARWPSWK
jgi:acetoin utilization deacetylase AcuC-like enzyme